MANVLGAVIFFEHVNSGGFVNDVTRASCHAAEGTDKEVTSSTPVGKSSWGKLPQLTRQEDIQPCDTSVQT